MAFSITKILKGLRLSTADTTSPANIDITPGGTDGTTTTITSTQTANRSITLPDRSGEIAFTSGSQTLTGTTIDGDDNTLLDISISSLKTVLGDANEVLVRDGAGAVVSAPLVNANVDPAAAIAYSKLNLSNSIVNADVAAAAAIARSKIASGTADHVVINSPAGALSSEAQLAISRGGTGQSTATAAFNALSPSTTKGDLIVHNGTDDVRFPVGADNTVPFADSTQATGIRWDTVGAATLDINGLTQETVVAPTTDFIPMYDTSAAANRKVTPSDLTNINNFTTETTVAQASDFLLMYDTSATANRKVTVENILKSGTNPTVQRFTTGTSLTYTTPANVKYIHVRLLGGGAGGCGGGTASVGAGGAGTSTTFGASSAGSGSQSNSNRGGTGAGVGSVSGTGTINIITVGGSDGGNSSTQARWAANGGASYFSGAGRGGQEDGASANAGGTNSGGGGGGGATSSGAGTVNVGGGGGGAGGYTEYFIMSPAATYTYTVGAGGAAGAAGTNGFAAGAGAAGLIEVTEYYH